MRFKTLRIAEHQRTAWYRDGDFQDILTPGKHRFWKRLGRTEFDTCDINDSQWRTPRLRYLVTRHRDRLEAHLNVVTLGAHEMGLLFVNKVATALLAPGSVSAFWKGANDIEVKITDVQSELDVPQAWVQAMNRAGNAMEVGSALAHVQPVQVSKGFEVVLLVDGEVERVLSPGRYAFWRAGRELTTLTVDKRLQEIEVNGQEILTKDRVSLRVNAALQYRVVDAVKAMIDTPDIQAFAYRSVQFALRQAIGTLTLDELLADKTQLRNAVQTDVATQLETVGGGGLCGRYQRRDLAG